ncbi:TIGR03790 family protein, partial [Verrucomicrobiota bacterium]
MMNTIFWGLMLTGFSAQALLPCETVLLVNTNSQDSLKIAANFAAMRKLPQQNIIHLGADETQHQITQEKFAEQVWEPVQKELKERGLDGHVLAWIYSAGFPYRVKTTAGKMSITGLTFTRNTVPEKRKVGKVSTMIYFSPLFRGPGDTQEQQAKITLSLDRFKQGLKNNMPIPAMMLGYTGKHGNTVEEVIESLKNGLRGDNTRPARGVHFVKTSDLHRSAPREWQFNPVQLELAERTIEATTTTNFPAHAENTWGLMTGQAHIVTEKIPTFVPGAMADHLTSFAATFDKNEQTKCSEWIRAGATATAGTVTEPYSIWWKFPHARFFTHYSHGCTILESFAQSILNPTQTLCLGEPFCRPWRSGLGVKLIGFPRTPISEERTVTALCHPQPRHPMKYTFFIDGKQVQAESPNASLRINPAGLSDGYHEFCAVAKV